MRNLILYAEEQLTPFSLQPFGQVDSLILSWVANLHFPLTVHGLHNWVGARLGDLFKAEYFPQLFQGLWDPASTRALFTALAASPRYRDILLMGYTARNDPTQEMQFTAVTFQVRSDLHYVAFGGTDTSLVGWKENFNMAYLCPVPAQAEAARYLSNAAARCPGPLLVGGHSKGGNLAVYAAAVSERTVQARIHRVYSHDGPGFPADFLQAQGYQTILPRVEKTIPQTSIVGLLLDQNENYQVVQSTRSSLLQHDPFSWVVDGDSFLYDQLTSDAQFWDQNLDQWLAQLSSQERARFVEALYDILSAVNAEDLSVFLTDWTKNLPALMHAARELDPDTRTFLFQVLKELAAISLRNVPDFFGRSTIASL